MNGEDESETETQVVTGADANSVVDADEPPVVARLVVEIRSDGTRTIARGGMEDHISGESVAVEARADSPIELATALARMILRSPSMAARALTVGSEDESGRPRRGRKRRALAKALRRRLLPDED